jgi:hypothetical protein
MNNIEIFRPEKVLRVKLVPKIAKFSIKRHAKRHDVDLGRSRGAKECVWGVISGGCNIGMNQARAAFFSSARCALIG